jgi:hypothetical protein
MKEAVILFVVQVVNYCLLTVNFRAVAQGEVALALATDAVIATMGFFIIRKISRTEDSTLSWAGYTAGSLVGTFLGFKLS